MRLTGGIEKQTVGDEVADAFWLMVARKPPRIRISLFYVLLEDFSTPMRHSTPNIRIIF
jgi:hypothetical protein